jgi:hypothetical protein
MKIILKTFLLSIFLFNLFIFPGCTGLSKSTLKDREKPLEEEAGPGNGNENNRPETPDTQDLYGKNSLLIPVIQFNYFEMSLDYFSKFVQDDDLIFSDYIFRIFGIENSPYKEGEGTTLISRTGKGDVYSTLERALIKINLDGSKWWQVKQAVRNTAIFYEVLISEAGTPLAIRYIDPVTGEKYETVPSIAKNIEEALEEMSSTVLKEEILERLEEEIKYDFNIIFNKPEIVGEEKIDVQAGTFKAFHIRDISAQRNKIDIDYWISRDVPGNIVKIVYSSAEKDGDYIVELVKISQNNKAVIKESDITRRDEFIKIISTSEGSRDGPIRLIIGEPHNGSVGPSGTSYYQFTVERRADIYIEATGLADEAELIYYDRDLTFEEWRTSSEGSTLNIEDYFVDSGTTLYFTIVEKEDENSYGENYTITITEDFILSKTGIRMQGEIHFKAFELKSGKIYFQTLNDDGLNYYKTIVKNGPNIRISVHNLSEHADLLWFDSQNGSYSGVYSTRHGETNRMDIRGVSEGTVCFFYIAGDTAKMNGKNTFKITIDEFSDL